MSTAGRNQKYKRKGRLPTVPLRALIPNMITMLALCAGLTGIKFAIGGKWEAAVYAIVIAAIFDGIDGTVARLLKGATRFGAELDSLSDVVAFGIAPAVVLYMWTLNMLGGIGWVVSLVYAGCCALRLARFNADLDAEEKPYRAAGFMTGVPAPAGAGLAILPMIVTFWTGRDELVTPAIASIYVAGVALLMVSRLPTFSLKSVRVRPSARLPLIGAVPLFVACLTLWPWITLSLMGAAYLISLPISYRSFKRHSGSA